MNIVFIRHCDPDYELDSLTPRGFKEAEYLAKRVLNWKIDDIYASPMGRAQETMNACVRLRKQNGINDNPKTLQFLEEFYYELLDPETNLRDKHCWDHLPSYFRNHPELHDKESWFESPLMKSEDIKSKYIKVIDSFDKLLSEYGYIRQANGTYSVNTSENKTIVCFCHFGISLMLISHLMNIAPTLMWQGVFLPPSSVSVMVSEEREEGIGVFRLCKMGSVSHLTKCDIEPSTMGLFTNNHVEF